MTLEEFYTAAGGSYAEVKSRIPMDKLIDRFVLKFPKDPTMQKLKEAVAAGNLEESFREAHTLKGVASNLAFTELTSSASALTEQLRPLTAPADSALLTEVEKAYNNVIEALKVYETEK